MPLEMGRPGLGVPGVVDVEHHVVGVEQPRVGPEARVPEVDEAPPRAVCRALQQVTGVAPGGEEVPRPFVVAQRSEEHTSELQSLMRISYAVFCLKKKNQ